MQNHGELPESMMKAMATKCPSCGTSFRVQQDQLTAAQGMVRCGSCLHIFQAQDVSSLQKPKIKLVEEEAKAQSSKKNSDDDSLIFEDDPLVDWEDDEIYGDDFPEALKPSRTPSSPVDDDDWASTSIDSAIASVQNRLVNSGLADQYGDDTNDEDVDESWAHELLAELEAEDGSDSQTTEKSSEPATPAKQEPLQQQTAKQKETGTKEDSKRHQKSAKKPQASVKKAAPAQAAVNRKAKVQPSPASKARVTNTQQKNVQANRAVTKQATATQAVPSASAKEIKDQPADQTQVQTPKSQVGRKRSTLDATNSVGSQPLADQNFNEEQQEVRLTAHPQEAAPNPAFKQARSYAWLWTSFNVLLVCALAFQYVYFHFEELSKRAKVRPLLSASCNIIGCQLPSIQDVKLVNSGNLVVREHPRKDDALIVDVIISNQAIFDQPFPSLELSFSDFNDNAVANRIFSPEEYLGGDLKGASLMPPKTPIHLSIEVLDPGPKATNYELHFHGS